MTLGLCSQIDLDAEVKKAAARLERDRKELGIVEPPKPVTLLPTEETTAPPPPEPERPMADRAGARGAQPPFRPRGA